jgi:hypothetical protein
MTEEVKKEEQKIEEKKQEVPVAKIAVDIDGVSVEVDTETAKKLIDNRQKAKKDVATLKESLAKAEATAKQEADRAALMKAMKESDIESVKAQISAEYIDKIAKYENKIFKEGAKSALIAAGILAEAADDAVSLALQGAKTELDGDSIKIGGKPLAEFAAEFVKTKPHLVAVKAGEKKTALKTGTPPAPARSTGELLKSGLSKIIK